MAWTSPKTYVTGDVLTAADMNTYQRDNTAWLATDKPRCRVYNTANISTNNATWTAMTCDSERFDVGGMHDTGSNTQRITVPSGGDGVYWVWASMEWAVNGTGSRFALIELNGTAGAGTFVGVCHYGIDSAAGVRGTVQTLYAAVATDYFVSDAYQTSGGALNVVAVANNSPEFAALWVAT